MTLLAPKWGSECKSMKRVPDETHPKKHSKVCPATQDDSLESQQRKKILGPDSGVHDVMAWESMD